MGRDRAVEHGGVLVGVLVHRPRRRWPWLLLAAALFAFGSGDFLYNLLTDVFGMANPFPSVSDVLYLAMYPLVAGGLLGFIRSRTGRNDRDSLLDATTLTIGLALLAWIFLIDPYVRSTELTVVQKLVSVAYPLGDVLTLAVFARLITGGTRRSPSIMILGVGTAGLLVADVAYGLIQLNGSWQVGGPTDLGWVLCYAGWAAAALHPSMAELTEPARSQSSDVGVRRIALLGAASLIAPGVLLVEASPARSATPPSSPSCRRHVRAGARPPRRGDGQPPPVNGPRAGAAGGHHHPRLGRRHRRDPRGRAARGGPAAAGRGRAHGGPGAGRTRRRTGAGPVSGLDPEVRELLRGYSSALRHPLGIERDMLYVGAPTEALQVLQTTSRSSPPRRRWPWSGSRYRRGRPAQQRGVLPHPGPQHRRRDPHRRRRRPDPVREPVRAGRCSATDQLAASRCAASSSRASTRSPPPARAAHPAAATQRRPTTCGSLGADGRRPLVEATAGTCAPTRPSAAWCVTLRDVTERRRLEARADPQAYHRRADRPGQPGAVPGRRAAGGGAGATHGAAVGVLFIDLDDFKVVNDTMGHARRRRAAVAVGQRLTEALRADDTVARLGGDEFAALVATAGDAGRRRAASPSGSWRARRAVRAAARRAGHGVASIGVATTAEAADAARTCCARPTWRCTWPRAPARTGGGATSRPARGDGGAAASCAPTLDRAVAERRRSCCTTSRSSTWRPGAPAGFEALVRWHHPTRGWSRRPSSSRWPRRAA